jgi:hypothetical protein
MPLSQNGFFFFKRRRLKCAHFLISLYTVLKLAADSAGSLIFQAVELEASRKIVLLSPGCCGNLNATSIIFSIIFNILNKIIDDLSTTMDSSGNFSIGVPFFSYISYCQSLRQVVLFRDPFYFNNFKA